MPEYAEVPEEVVDEILVVDAEVEEPEEAPKRKYTNHKKVDVDVMPVNLFDDVYVVVTQAGYPEAFLVPKTEFEEGLQPGLQKMEKQVLDRAPQAHDFGPELAPLMPTIGEVLLAFYRVGIVDMHTLNQGQRYRNALVRVMPRLSDIRAASEG